MPKMKTKSGAAKRFIVRASGSIKHAHAFKRHILTKKTAKTKRQLRGTVRWFALTWRLFARCCLTRKEEKNAKSKTWGDGSCPSQESAGPREGLSRASKECVSHCQGSGDESGSICLP